jgi:RinA family phage transcriptional activator
MNGIETPELAVQEQCKDKTWFKKTERRLYAYPDLLIRHRMIEREFKENHPLKAQKLDHTGGGTSNTKNRVARFVIQQEAMHEKLLADLAVITKEKALINEYLDACTEDEKMLIEKRYFKKMALLTVQYEMGLSKTAYYRMRQKVIARAAMIFGYLDYEMYCEMLCEG